jgi:adenylate cyclase
MSSESAALLVVDDNEDNRYTLTQRLKRLGYANLATAHDGRAALDLLRTRPFDLVLLDIMMPELNGYQVLEQLKADERLRHIPVIMISAVDELDSVIRCIELGAEDYLSKPFNPTLLGARVGACLEKKRLHDELAEWARTLEQRVQEKIAEVERLARLKRFFSPQLAEAILSTGGEKLLESHRREITVVFCDLRGFTAFSETAEPEEVMAVLREYHSTIGPLIFEAQGTLEQFAGDGVMVFFNDPVPCPAPSASAVRMALAMREAVADLRSGWRRRGHQLDLGVGIAHGYATLGTIGFEGRFEYSAIGPVTNLACRLCDEARGGEILVSPRVFAAVEEFVETEPPRELTLKGFHRAVEVRNVVRLRG